MLLNVKKKITEFLNSKSIYWKSTYLKKIIIIIVTSHSNQKIYYAYQIRFVIYHFFNTKEMEKKKYNNPERNIHIYLFIPKLLKSAIGNALKKKNKIKNNTS